MTRKRTRPFHKTPRPAWAWAALALAVLAAGCEQGSTRVTQQNDQDKQSKDFPVVVIETSAGTIKAELWPDKAPVSVENFLTYVDADFYDGTVFHRTIRGFMVQGGGMTPDGAKKQTRGPIKNEADNGLKNLRGTLAMARTSDVNSATSQFFINTADNAFLDHGVRDFGYAVFGQVTEGMDVVDAIEQAPVSDARAGTPVQPVVIKSIRRAQ